MQTFLPCPHWQDSAAVLDDRRLVRQTQECQTIMKALAGLTKGWTNHCITRMWRGNEWALWFFWDACWGEAKKRGLDGICDSGDMMPHIFFPCRNYNAPEWFTDKRIFTAYRSHLLAKDEGFYRQWGWTEPAVSGYWAPDKDGNWIMYSDEEQPKRKRSRRHDG